MAVKDFPLPKYKMQEIIDRLKKDNAEMTTALTAIAHQEPSCYLSAVTLARLTLERVRG